MFLETDYDLYDFRDKYHGRFSSWELYILGGHGPIPKTMELSPSSGLEGKLEDPEVFGFQGVDHLIQKPELCQGVATTQDDTRASLQLLR